VPTLLAELYPNESAVERGVRGLGYGFSILIAATLVNMALSTTGHARELLLGSLAMMGELHS
jgi:hypothetical protein